MKNYIKVSFGLRPEQFISMNKWKCTINGEERIVCNKVVNFYAEDIFQAVNSFDEREILWWSISREVDTNEYLNEKK